MNSAPENLHINVPELLSRRRRFRDAFVTAFMWLVYTYLWAPFVSLIAWLLGFEFAYDVMIRSGGIQGLKNVLSWYGLMLGCIIIVVTSWSLVNRLRFSGRERRQGATQPKRFITASIAKNHNPKNRSKLPDRANWDRPGNRPQIGSRAPASRQQSLRHGSNAKTRKITHASRSFIQSTTSV